MNTPSWLHTLAILSLTIAWACSVLIALDIAFGRRQRMWIMNIVWPLTGLYAGPLGLWAYIRIGRLSTQTRMQQAERRSEEPPSQRKPFWQKVLVGTTHCGSACTLGDLVAEWGVIVLPLALFGNHVFGTWAADYFLAFLFGIAFQYFTIAPMRGLSPREGIVAAIKADIASLTAWQIGMYGWMALVLFVWFGELPKTDPVFWFMMQIAMVAGFIVSYPVNAWLIRSRLKEAM